MNTATKPMGINTRYALALLFMVSFFNYMDRYMLAVLLPAIKADLQLSDTEIGFITGLAFTLFYATMGIPIARLADRYSRRNIIAIALSNITRIPCVTHCSQSACFSACGRPCTISWRGKPYAGSSGSRNGLRRARRNTNLYLFCAML